MVRRSQVLLRWTQLLVAGLALSVLSACAGGIPFMGTPEGTADIVFYGEHIHTVDEGNAGATAVAVRGDEIVAVGDRI